MIARRARLVWALFAVTAGALALVAMAHWADALVTGRPVLYGEGAVAHAAILFREGAAYRDATGTVAANYPPLYLALASVGDPFRTGRALTIASAVAVGALVWWRARDAGPVPRTGLALGWLALAPVAIRGAAVKPDLVAVALTAFGVALLERRSARTALAGGALLALAAWAKPTALLPAAAVLAWLALRDRPAFWRAMAGAATVAALALAQAAALGAADVWRHVVLWNALPWDVEQAVRVLIFGAGTVGLLAVIAGAMRGIVLAYLLGALGVAVLGGREGATINYLLDLAAATTFGLATASVRWRSSAWLPGVAILQIALGVALLAPFGIGREPTTGAWGAPERVAVVRSLGPGEHLVEDSGLLVADGRSPVLDDLFLWSRLGRLGIVDVAPLVRRVRDGELASVVSEADLARLAEAPAHERARWHPDLVRAVLERYALERSTGALWVYRPR